MLAVILAAGRGSRMGGATDERPKGLTRLGGRSLIEWQVAALRAAGITRIAIVTGYRSEMIEHLGFETILNPRWAETNMVASLASAADLLRSSDAVVSYSDIVYSPAAPRRLVGATGRIAITFDESWLDLWQARFPDPLEDAETFVTRAGRLVEIGARAVTLGEIQGQYMGLLRFTPAGWQRVEQVLSGLSPAERDRIDMTSLLRRLVETGEPIETVPVDGGWCEVDTESDLRLYEARVRAEKQAGSWKHDWRWPESSP